MIIKLFLNNVIMIMMIRKDVDMIMVLLLNFLFFVVLLIFGFGEGFVMLRNWNVKVKCCLLDLFVKCCFYS